MRATEVKVGVMTGDGGGGDVDGDGGGGRRS